MNLTSSNMANSQFKKFYGQKGLKDREVAKL